MQINFQRKFLKKCLTNLASPIIIYWSARETDKSLDAYDASMLESADRHV